MEEHFPVSFIDRPVVRGAKEKGDAERKSTVFTIVKVGEEGHRFVNDRPRRFNAQRRDRRRSVVKALQQLSKLKITLFFPIRMSFYDRL